MDEKIEQEVPAQYSKKKHILMGVFLGAVLLIMTTGVGFILWKLLGVLK